MEDNKLKQMMEALQNKEKIRKWFAPDKLVIGLLLGALLLVVAIPTEPKKNTDTTSESTSSSEREQASFETDYVKQMEEKLEKTLMGLSGVQQIRVMITLKASKEEVINKDTPYSQTVVSETGEGTNREQTDVENKEETVLISENGDTKPYVVKELYPEVEGILVVVQGKMDIMLKSEITEVVEVLFDVEPHKVKVLGTN